APSATPVIPRAAAPAAPAVDEAHTIFEVPVADINRSPWQPRQTFDAEALRELADSIKLNGIITPLLCRKVGGHTYELIAGERRLRAAIDVGLTKVPVRLIDAVDRQAAELAIIENIQRQDLNVIEEAEGYRSLADQFHLTQQEIAERVGKARASVANAMRLLELPDEVKQMVGGGILSIGHAKVLLGLTDATEQTLLGRKSVTDALTVRQLERLIQKRRETPAAPKQKRFDMPDAYVRDLSDRLHRHFGTSVRLTPSVTHANGRHTKGVLEIDFYDNDDLDRLLNLFGVRVD
ncbi:MAG: ParB/RepB/Spo0J family partition protein, partial [Kiritimatiellae bacterium]|nr:ParB/RepB/Spo0J family partition protein [Kiritimatiellia bacterium]